MDKIERAREAIAQALSEADARFDHSIRLTKLVDDASEYTAIVTNRPPSTFSDYDEASAYVQRERQLFRADAVLAALREPSNV